MDLMDNFPEDNKKSSGAKTAFIIVIVLIFLLIIAAGVVWVYAQDIAKNQFKFYIDGSQQSGYSDSLFLYEDDTTYVSIKDVATLIDYRVYNGGYEQYTEDTTKCYVNNSKEVVSFEAGSSKIYKYNVINSADSESQNFTLSFPIKSSGSNLYISIEDMKIAFNALVTEDTNSVSIYTLSYLAEYYAKQVSNAAVTSDNSDFSESVLFNNQKALLYNLIVIRDENTEMYGVASLSDPTTSIISMRYSSVEFIEGSNDFIVATSSSSTTKYGIIGSDGVTKVKLDYDSIIEIDKNLGLYLVTSNNKQGVVNKNGKTIVYQDYDQIGLSSTISDSNVTNKYIILDNCIPVKRNGYWGLIDINGNEILPVEYDGIGCAVSSSQDTRYSDVIVVPELKAIVIEKDETLGNTTTKKYGMIKSDGSAFVNYVLDEVYSLTSQGETTYYATWNNETINLVDYIEQEQSETTVSTNDTKEDTENTTNEAANETTTSGEE